MNINLLPQRCDIMGRKAPDRTNEFDENTNSDVVLFSQVPCRLDTSERSRTNLPYPAPAAMQNRKRGMMFIWNDPRFGMPFPGTSIYFTNVPAVQPFAENNWIRLNGHHWVVYKVDEIYGAYELDHYEVLIYERLNP